MPGRTPQLLLAAALLAAALAAPGCQPGGLKGDDSDPAIAEEQRLREAGDLAFRAKTAADKGKNDQAIDLNRRAIALNPNHVGAWNNLGALLMARQNYRDAMQAFERAADLLPKDPRPYENLALCWYEMGYDDNALSYYRKSLERDPNWLPSLRGNVACLQRLNKADDPAIDQIKRGLMIEYDPTWRSVFERARLRIDAARNANAPGSSPTSSPTSSPGPSLSPTSSGTPPR
ncbi:MAG: tetratricopeptide repeat protein [Phycisphaerales bacterium]|nr:tetratricopeptide repeat protein [Phycisphaerales bacterium]